MLRIKVYPKVIFYDYEFCPGFLLSGIYTWLEIKYIAIIVRYVAFDLFQILPV